MTHRGVTEELIPWFILKSVPGIGNLLFKRLMDRFQSPKEVLGAKRADLREVEGISAAIADRIATQRCTDGILREIHGIHEKGYALLTMADRTYPPLLRQIADPPPMLYIKGKLPDENWNIAVVGSRMATDYGVAATRELAKQLAGSDVCVVSGMARGIDTAAHEGAIMGGGKTVAVLGSGIDVIYPRTNRRLYERISESGAVLSELPLGTEPEAHNFPARNRIISGMSLGVVIVEATRRSGSLITARLAAEQGRDVFAVPGSIRSFKSTGTHFLLKQGAKLVESAQDIMEEFQQMPVSHRHCGDDAIQEIPEKLPDGLSVESRSVYRYIEPYPMHIDDLVRKTGIPAGRLAGLLLELELAGIVCQSAGKRFYKAGSRQI